MMTNDRRGVTAYGVKRELGTGTGTGWWRSLLILLVWAVRHGRTLPIDGRFGRG